MTARAHVAFALVALLALLPPSLAAGTPEDGFAAEALHAFAALKRVALAGAPEGEDGSPTARTAEKVFSISRVPASDALDAWQLAEASDPSNARARVLEAEAAMLGVAAANARLALAEGETGEAKQWLRTVLGRIQWQARAVPADAVLASEEPDPEAFIEVLDAALAIRAREEAVQAMLLGYAGDEENARASADGAQALSGILVPNVSSRLSSPMRGAFEANASVADTLLDRLPGDRAQHVLTGLIGPLVSIEYNRDIEPLDEFASRNVDAAFVASRAAREDRHLLELLAREALAQYASDRAGLFIRGEGEIDGVDRAYHVFRDTASTGDVASVAAAAAGVRSAMRPLALMERGVVLKVETGGVQGERGAAYRVWLVRPPLEGVASYRIRLEYDPSVVEVTGVVPRKMVDSFDFELSPGNVTLTSVSDPLSRSATIALLALETRGPPNAMTPLQIAEADFIEPDGDSATIFRLRDGSATVTYVERRGDEGESETGSASDSSPPRSTPAPGILAGLVFAAAAARIPGGRRK